MAFWHILVVSWLLGGEGEPEKELVITSKTITVYGQTSIGDFSCCYSQNGIQDTLTLNPSQRLDFQIPVDRFSCGNFLLNRDFRQTLKANEYPKTMVEATDFRAELGYIVCNIAVEIAGKVLEFTEVQMDQHENKLETCLSISFQELDLKPPSKLGGLVQVDDELSINFSLGI